tara:strand:+ start:279 stop:533 length:255 start_codon:yes stop_codon:yes gene_type:complete
MGVTELHAKFWREDGQRLEDENAELREEVERLRAELARVKKQRNTFSRGLKQSNQKCTGYYNLCSKWNLVGGTDTNGWTVVKGR